MKEKTPGLLIYLFMIIAVGCGEPITIIDFTGHEVDISAPVNTTISLAGAGSEIIWALDGGKSMIGRSEYSDFPPIIENVPIVGKSSNSPDLEKILELKPDLVIADGMLSEEDRKVLEEDGVAVIVERFTDPYRTLLFIENLGKALGKQERADELFSLLKGYQDLIKERTSGLTPEDKPTVFLEWLARPYHSASNGTSYHNQVTFAGGVNIAADETVNYPDVSPEWVMEKNPDILLHILGSTANYSEEELRVRRDEIMSRPELQNLRAVKEGRVYVLSGTVITGVRSAIGELYLAKWFYPELFEDINPGSEHERLIEKFYNIELEDAYGYPYPSTPQDVLLN
ncbi:MAG: Cobalamin-binding protein precursor [Methanosaeta sp. PtaB.Bin039]|nr:MAG: Cobalamin-binding protein precursor [Methanosaeta sp. PtaB.Bin039]